MSKQQHFVVYYDTEDEAWHMEYDLILGDGHDGENVWDTDSQSWEFQEDEALSERLNNELLARIAALPMKPLRDGDPDVTE